MKPLNDPLFQSLTAQAPGPVKEDTLGVAPAAA